MVEIIVEPIPEEGDRSSRRQWRVVRNPGQTVSVHRTRKAAMRRAHNLETKCDTLTVYDEFAGEPVSEGWRSRLLRFFDDVF